MVVVVFGTFEWSSIPIVLTSFLPQRVRKMWSYTAERKVNRYDALVIVVVTVVTLTNDLFIAVLAGVFLTSTATAWTLGENMTLLESVTVRGNGLGISYGGVGPVKEEDVLVQVLAIFFCDGLCLARVIAGCPCWGSFCPSPDFQQSTRSQSGAGRIGGRQGLAGRLRRRLLQAGQGRWIGSVVGDCTGDCTGSGHPRRGRQGDQDLSHFRAALLRLHPAVHLVFPVPLRPRYDRDCVVWTPQ